MKNLRTDVSRSEVTLLTDEFKLPLDDFRMSAWLRSSS